MYRRAAEMPYTDLSEHRWMIGDRVRTSAYDAAIREVVRPGDVVLDFGCGLGILAMMAARAGARKVYAADRLSIVRLAQAIAKKNGLSQIDFILAEDSGFDLPEKVDVVVSEWMGHFAVHEGMIGPLCAARDRHLREGGRMVPGRVTMRAALVVGRSPHDERALFQNAPCGFDFSPVADWAFGEVSGVRFRREELLGAAEVASLEMGCVTGMPRSVAGEIAPDREATIYGIAGWFDADLTDGVRFGTGPDSEETHWCPLYFPFVTPMAVSPSRPVRVRLSPVQLDVVHTRWHWWAGDGAEERSGDDMTLLAYLRRPLPKGLLK